MRGHATEELRLRLRKRNIQLAETAAEVPSVLAEQFGGSQALGQVVAWKPLPNGIVVGEAISLQLVSDVAQHKVIADVIEQDLRHAAGVESRHGTQARNGASGRARAEARAARSPGARRAVAQARARPRVTAQLSAPAIGYRAFKWDGTGPLRSTGVEASWPITREPQRAKCITTTQPAHDAPQEDCTCGLYAHSTPDAVSAGIGAVVMGYGNLIIHPDGWRAETAELVALVLSAAPGPRWQSSASPEAIEMCAEQYGVRALDRWEDAAALARELGAEPVPEILHAEAEAWLLGPEKHEPLFPNGMTTAYGDLEQQIREMLPWITRESLMHVEMRQDPYAFSPLQAGVSMSFSVASTVTVRARHPQHGAEVEVTLRG